MPGLNSTGPEGQGPRTGRQMGNCKPADEEVESRNGNFAGREFRRGRGFGRMQGFGKRRGFGRGRGLGRGQTPE